MKILIQNTTIADGSGGALYKGSILIENDRLVSVGAVSEAQADRVIDGAGLVAAPGFIDTHSHSDLRILTEPEVLPKITQGITTEILGQDGISMAPLPEEYISPWRKNLAGLDGDSDRVNWRYQTTDGYLAELLRARPGLNVAYLVPHGNVRMEAMGLSDAKPTAAQLQKMCEIVRREMKAGAIGLSSGLIYIPCAYGDTEELIALCRVVASLNGVFVVHQRSEADGILESMDEILEVGRRSGVRLHFSHFKVCGRTNWDKIGQVLAKLDAAKEEGLSVSFDQYPYVAGSTMLGVILPPWAHDGGTVELLTRL
jgi:N-acyl-D-amino-acid deacylase